MLRTSPLDAWHRKNGARMIAFGGWEMPLEYQTGTLAEHLACRRRAALFDVSHLGTVRVEGKGAFERLQGELSNDLAKISPGRAQYTHLLDDDGSVLDDIIVWWVEERRFDVMPNASNTSRVLEALGGEDVTAERAVIAVQGPEARAILSGVFPEAAEVAHNRVRAAEWKGSAVVVAGTGYTGEDGVEVAISPAAASDFCELLVNEGVRPAGLGARDTLRLEAGLPLHGHELGAGITPLEAGLSWVVAWQKPSGFRGKQALLAQREAGPGRLLRGVVGTGRQPLRASQQVLLRGARSGPLTSGNFSPVLGRGIGMCFLPPDVQHGEEVEVDVRGRLVSCHVSALPFVPKATTKPKMGAEGTRPEPAQDLGPARTSATLNV